MDKKHYILHIIIHSICTAVAMTVLWGCHGGRSERLRAIDAIMEDDPALALAQLDSVDRSALSEADYPYYCLLYTQAQVKNNIVLDNDSLIHVACEAYTDCGDDDLRRRAYFYNAQVAYYAKDYRTAMRDILPAYEIAKEQNDPYWTAKAAEIIADIYFDVFNYEQSAVYRQEAAERYEEAGKISNHRYALSDLSATLLNAGRTEEAVRLIDSLHNAVMIEVPLDSGLYEYMKLARSGIYNETGRLDELTALMKEGINMSLSDETKSDIAVIESDAKNKSGDYVQADKILTIAAGSAPADQERLRVLYASYGQAMANGDYAKAAAMTDTLLHLQSAVRQEMLKESVTEVQSEFNRRKAETNERKATTQFWLAFGLASVLVIIALWMVIYHKLKMRVKEGRLEMILESLNSYEAQFNEANIENYRLEKELQWKSDEVKELTSRLSYRPESIVDRKDVEDLFRNRWQTLNMLCEEYFEKWDNEKIRHTILNKLRKEVSIQTSPDRIADIEQSVDMYMGGIMSMLRKEFPEFKSEDLNLMTLIFAGLSHRASCLFMDLTNTQYYKRRSRLKNLIKSSQAPHRDLFLDKFEKLSN